LALRDPLHWVPVKYKLVLVFAGVCLLAFGVGGTLVSRSAKSALEREILARLEFQARAYATALDGELELLTRRTEDFASDGFIRDHAEELGRPAEELGDEERARLESELRAHLVANKLPLVPAFLDLLIVSADGRPRLTASGAPEPAAGVLAALCAGRSGSFTSDLLPPEGAAGFPRLSIATPLTSRQGERHVGHLVALVHPGVWAVKGLRSSETGVEEAAEILHLSDTAGRRLAISPHLTRTGGPAADSELVRSGFGLELSAAEGNAPARPGVPTRKVFGKAYPLATNGWSLWVGLRSEDALAAVAGLQSRFLLVGIVLAAAASLLLLFPMRFLARPIALLSEGARRIRDGDFATRVEIDNSDEFGDLARSFNLMSAAVEERTQRLEASAGDLRSERDRLNAVISSMRDGLVVLDADGQPVVSNRAGRPLLDMLRDERVPALSHNICEHGRAGDEHCRECLFDVGAPPRSCVIDVGGGVYEVHVTRLAPDSSGRSGSVLLARDISDRVAQDERQIHQERLAVLGEVAAVMAHELNNPLAAISMYNQMLRAELGRDSGLRANVEVIQRNVESCKRAIRELLDYATASTPEITGLDVRDTLEDVATFLRPLRERSGVELELDLGREPLLVSGDEVQIRQIFVNLIVNAIQAIEGGGHVVVQARAGGDHVLVEVSDSGCGIDPQARELVFRPFYTTKARGEGTGLGLPTSRRIAEMHGGSLELVASGPGGTRFRVRLRRRVEGAARAAGGSDESGGNDGNDGSDWEERRASSA